MDVILISYSGTSSDDTLIIATQRPAAIQCISWNPHEVNSTQTSVQNKLGFFIQSSGSIHLHMLFHSDVFILISCIVEKIVSAVYDKTMNISLWITDAGRVYFVQNTNVTKQRRRSSNSHHAVSWILVKSSIVILTHPYSCSHPHQQLLLWMAISHHQQCRHTENQSHGTVSVFMGWIRTL